MLLPELRGLRLGVFGCGCKRPGSRRAMQQPRAPLWLLGAVLGASLRGGCCEPRNFQSSNRFLSCVVKGAGRPSWELQTSGSPSHSLCYFYLQLPEPSQGQPQSFVRSYLDEQPIARFDSLTRKMEPLVPWMEEEEEKERFLAPERVFRADLEKLSELDQLAGGLHTWQAVLGCQLWAGESKGGFLHYGYDGMDFIGFDKESLRWKTAQHQAQKVKEKWEEDPGWSKKVKSFLEEACIEWLQRYLSYQKEALQRTEPPVGMLTRKVVDDSLEVLICQAFGFYPKEIKATWRRDGEVCQNETLQRNVAPNSDGTYYVRLSIEIDPKERDRFRCHLEHEGLPEPLVLAWKEESVWWIPLGMMAAMILACGIFFLKCWRRRRCRKKRHQEETSCSDQVSLKMLPSSTSAEDEIQSYVMLHPTIT